MQYLHRFSREHTEGGSLWKQNNIRGGLTVERRSEILLEKAKKSVGIMVEQQVINS